MTRATRPKRTRVLLLWIVLSLMLAFAFNEIAVRILLAPPPTLRGAGYIYDSAIGDRGHEPDPEIGWVLSSQPVRRRHRYEGEDGKVVFDVTYNIENGHRATSPEAMNGREIICTGCSFTFGHGLEDEDTWPWLLQERIRDHRVVNVASMAYGTDQALLAARREALSGANPPRVVVLGFADFQVERNRSSQGWLQLIHPFGKPLFLTKGDGIESRGLVHFLAPGRIVGMSALASHAASKITHIVRGIPSQAEARELTARLILHFHEWFASRGVRLVVVELPWYGDRSSGSLSDREPVLARLRAKGVPVLSPEFPRLENGTMDGNRFFIPGELHPNRAYNTVVADAVQSYLVGEGFLPRSTEPDRASQLEGRAPAAMGQAGGNPSDRNAAVGAR